MFIATIIITILLAALLLATGGGKLTQQASSLKIRDDLKLNNRTWRAIGLLEMLAVVGLIVGLLVPTIGALASAGVTALMLGAVVVRVRAGQRHASGYVADVVVLCLGVALTTLQLAAA